MARPKQIANIEMAEKAQAELKKHGEHKICLRLLAIIASADHPLHQVASMLKVSRSQIHRWIKLFKTQGITGLYDRPRGHKAPKLNEEHRQTIFIWLRDEVNSKGEPAHWTLAQLASEVQTEFNLEISTPTLWRLIRSLGFRQKVPRPVHAKSDPKAQEVFKKNR